MSTLDSSPDTQLPMSMLDPVRETQVSTSTTDPCPNTQFQLSMLDPFITVTSTAAPHPLVTFKRNVSASPATSPHKLGKIGPKRRRTMQAIKGIPLVQKESHRLPQHATIAMHSGTLSDFQESEKEHIQREHMSSMMFTYMLQKHSLKNFTKYQGQVLKEFREFLPPNKSVTTQTQDKSTTTGVCIKESKIHYMDLVDENPDSDVTMLYIGEKLLEVVCEHQTIVWT